MKSLNFSARFIELAGEVNSHMPEFVLEKVTRALNDQKKAVNGSKILVMGVAYKANVSDMRESPALDLIHLLNEQGGDVSYHDPFIPSITIGRLRLTSQPYAPKKLKQYDAVVITTAHDAFKAKEILDHSKLVIDTRNIMRGLSANHLVRL